MKCLTVSRKLEWSVIKFKTSNFKIHLYFLFSYKLMPAIKVFDFTQKIKDYVRNVLNHKDWYINSILVFYSTRSKATKFGYKVTPFYVGVTAKDLTNNCGTNCRIQFDEICKIIDPISCCSIVPYISVSTSNKNDRSIFDTGVTYLKIDCTKTGIYNGSPWVKHSTVRVDNKPHFDKLNASVLENIKERLANNHNADMKEMETQFRELLEDDETTAVNPLRHC